MFIFRRSTTRPSEVIVLLTLPRLKYRPRALPQKILGSKSLKKPRSPSLQIILPAMQRPLKKLGKNLKKGFRRKTTNTKTLALVLLLLMVIRPPTKPGQKTLKKLFLGLYILTTIKKNIIFRLVPIPKKTIL